VHGTETSRSLSRAEAKIILDLEWRGQKLVSAAELRSMLGASEAYAKFLAHRLVQKGWLERIRPGLFRLVPADRGPQGIADTNALAAGALLVSPYFYSFGTACTHHGFTEQVFTEAYIATRSPKRPKSIRGMRFVFVPMAEERFFGFDDVEVLGEQVTMAAKERAVLDAVDRPHLAGGLPEVSRIVAKGATQISWPTLIKFARRWNESALVQRLGYVVDLHRIDVSPHARKKLLGLVNPASKVHLASRAEWGTAGPLNRPWGIIENIPRDRLIEVRAGRGRTRSFRKTMR
jgi:predicted transcriptional regulator of viral defense system